eukprot:UN33506
MCWNHYFDDFLYREIFIIYDIYINHREYVEIVDENRVSLGREEIDKSHREGLYHTGLVMWLFTGSCFTMTDKNQSTPCDSMLTVKRSEDTVTCPG